MNTKNTAPPGFIKAIFPLRENTATPIAREDFDAIAAFGYRLFAFPNEDKFILEAAPRTIEYAMQLFRGGARTSA